jgi:hypothetical protein
MEALVVEETIRFSMPELLVFPTGIQQVTILSKSGYF